jgi:peptidoglycan/xylan/chitin deacetylase (PgdA/CDA1 family)
MAELRKNSFTSATLGEVAERAVDLQRRIVITFDDGYVNVLLTRLEPRLAREEIFSSKKKLEDLFGRAIEHFCYPYGDCNSIVRDWVIEAGYRTAATTEFGVNTPGTSCFTLKRITARNRTRSPKTLLERIRLRSVL